MSHEGLEFRQPLRVKNRSLFYCSFIIGCIWVTNSMTGNTQLYQAMFYLTWDHQSQANILSPSILALRRIYRASTVTK
jgi:hypothetical protein